MKTIRKGSTAAVLSRLLIAAVVFMLAVAGFGVPTVQAAGVVSNRTRGSAVAAWMAQEQLQTLA